MPLISKEEISEIEKNEGEVIGNALKNKLSFVLKTIGEDGVKRVEEEIAKLGYPLRYKEIKNFHWYPEKQDVLLIVLIKRLFNWDDEKIREMGRFNGRVSLIAKLMMRYFVSIERIARRVGEYWQKYRTIGTLEAEEVNTKEKRIILVLKNFTGHPDYCRFLEGYFWQIASYVVPGKEKLKVEESECVFKGSKVHRFKITW